MRCTVLYRYWRNIDNWQVWLSFFFFFCIVKPFWYLFFSFLLPRAYLCISTIYIYIYVASSDAATLYIIFSPLLLLCITRSGFISKHIGLQYTMKIHVDGGKKPKRKEKGEKNVRKCKYILRARLYITAYQMRDGRFNIQRFAVHYVHFVYSYGRGEKCGLL